MSNRTTPLIPLAFLAFVSLGLPDTLLGVAWPSIRATFGRPISSLGLLAAFGTAGYFCSSFFAGSFMNRVGVGWLLVTSCGVVTLSLVGYATSPVWTGLLACAFLAGIGAGAIDAGINAFAARAFTPRVLNWLHACWGLGATIGPLVMTATLRADLGWRAGYFVVGVVIFALALVFLATRRLWHLPPAVTLDGEATLAPAGLVEAIRERRVQARILFFLCYCAVEMGAGNWLFAMLTESRGLPIAEAGSLVAAYWASLTVGRIGFGQLAHAIGGVAVVRTGLVGAIVAAALLLPGLPTLAAIVAPCLLGLSLAPLFPTMVALTPARVGDRLAAQGVALQVSAAGIGIATGSALIGLLARRFGVDVLPIVLLVVGGLLLAIFETIERLPRPQQIGVPVAIASTLAADDEQHPSPPAAA